MGRLWVIIHPFINMNKFTLQTNLIRVVNVGKNSAIQLIFMYIREPTQGRRHFLCITSEESLQHRSNLHLHKKKILWRNPKTIMNVGKFLARGSLLMNNQNEINMGSHLRANILNVRNEGKSPAITHTLALKCSHWRTPTPRTSVGSAFSWGSHQTVSPGRTLYKAFFSV